jgi:hypothetical protein
MACPSQPPCRFDTKVESQIQPGEKPADSVNPENALETVLNLHSSLCIAADLEVKWQLRVNSAVSPQQLQSFQRSGSGRRKQELAFSRAFP